MRSQQFIQATRSRLRFVKGGLKKGVRFLTSPLRKLVAQMQLGRIFRRMGLPFWTFLGVGIAGWWFDNASILIETLLQHLLGLKAAKMQNYLPPLIMFAIPFVVVLVVGLWQKTHHQLAKAGFLSDGLRQPEGRKGLIVLVSNPNSAIVAIDYHFLTQGTLERVWLIPSNDTELERFGLGSQGNIGDIEQYCEDLAQHEGRELRVEVHPHGVSPADAQDTFDYVNRVFRRSGYPPEELIADFTGGTKPMAVGMIMACLPKGRELEYVSFNRVSKQSYGPFLVDYQHSAFDLVG